MSDGIEPTAAPSADPEATAPQSAATGDAPTNGAGSAAADDAATLAKHWERKNAASFRKGKAEGKAEVFGELGYDEEQVRKILASHAAAEEEQEQAAEQSEQTDLRATIRKHRTELRETTGKLEQATALVTRLQEQNDRARRAELRARLLESGAHPDAVADLVELNADRVAWAEDGDGLEVVEPGPDGKPLATGQSLDELIEEQREKRRYAFAGPAARGSGTTATPSAAPRGSAPSQRRGGWKERVIAARKGPE